MGPYICQNFQLLMLYNFQFHHMVWKRFPTVLKSFSIFVRKGGKWQKLNFWNEDFFGMCSYTLVRTFRMTFETFFNFFIWSKTPFLTFGTQKTRKIKFLGRGVLRDEFLLMWELPGWQSEHFLIASYGPKLHSWPFVLKKTRKIKFAERGVLWDEFLHM